MKDVLLLSVVLAAAVLTTAFPVAAAEWPTETVDKAIDIAPVWSGHPVGFALLTHAGRQYVAFYDAERKMTVASRPLDSDRWTMVRLPRTTGWDSHNYIAMTVDDNGHLHLAGDMHVVPLLYFRTRTPGDITTFEKIDRMVGTQEDRCTYPVFLRGPKNELLFTYRDGSSGKGDQIWNVYDHATKTWRRLLDKPLTDGKGKMNAYFHGPVKGPDGWFHLVWVWRDHPGAESNHDLSYARTRDLVHWETSGGKSLNLPITLETGEVIDPVPPGGGIINGNTVIGFDSQKRPVVGYHKYDAAGKTQIYNARLEDGRWRIYQASDWDYRWEFGGGGSLVFEVGLGPVQAGSDGRLTQSYRHSKNGSGVWVLDEATLKPTATLPPRPGLPRSIAATESAYPGMQVKTSGDTGKSGEDGIRYVLRWETLSQNRDRPRETVPPPTMLRLYRLKSGK